jgi:hypothetical protein
MKKAGLIPAFFMSVHPLNRLAALLPIWLVGHSRASFQDRKSP